jgi:class 3 adenylate cyclase/pimeloyl-ACP methyl ester carboxylesterase
MDPPETRYARSGDIHIAYQVSGRGPPDVVWVPGYTSNLDTFWDFPEYARFSTRLASFCRLIRFDKRGTGLSDRAFGVPTLEERMDDVRAVMDEVGCSRAALLGQSEGGPMSILFAATYPERTRALILYGAFAQNQHSRLSADQFEGVVDIIDRNWGTGVLLPFVAPSRRSDEAFARAFARFERSSATPAAAIALSRLNREVDVRQLLGAIHVPTLVLHRANDVLIDVDNGRYLGQQIQEARYIELPGSDHYPFIGDSDRIVDEIEEFLAGSRSEAEIDRVLATVLFTDIVDSTKHAAALGDRTWRALLDRHDEIVRQQLSRFRGREIKNLGDGFLATFDGPARAVRCASAIADTMQPLGLVVRGGLHTGEIELKGDDIGGIAVNIAARVAAMAGPNETLVSRTVRDLVAGSGLHFDDRGLHELKGLPEQVHLYSAGGST